MLNASADTTASARIGPRQPQPRDAKPPHDGFSSLVDSNAASAANDARDRAPREPDQPSRTSASQKSREQDDRTRDTDRPSSSDDSSAPEPVATGKTDKPADAPKKAAGDKSDKSTDQPAQQVVDATALNPTTVTPDAGKTVETIATVPVPVVPPPAPVIVSAAPTPLAIAAAGIAAAKAEAAKTSNSAAVTDTSDPANPDAAAAQTAGTTAKAAGAAEVVAVKVDARLGTPIEAKPPPADSPAAPVVAKTAAKPDAAATDAKSKDATATDDAKPSTASPVQPHDHRSAAVAAAPDLTATDPQLVAPQPTAHTTAPVSATAQLTATVATAAPVPLNGLAVELAARAQSGATRFDIRLDPAELGRIDVRIDIDKQGQVTSHLTVEKPETLAMLRQDSPQLQRALTDAGLKTSDGGLQFTLGDQSQPRQQADSGERQAQRFIIRDDDTAAPIAPVRGYGRMLAASSGVDISV